MPFNVHLADNEDAIIQAKSSRQTPRRSKATREFLQGLGVGFIFIVCLIATYWFASEIISRSSKLCYRSKDRQRPSPTLRGSDC